MFQFLKSSRTRQILFPFVTGNSSRMGERESEKDEDGRTKMIKPSMSEILKVSTTHETNMLGNCDGSSRKNE